MSRYGISIYGQDLYGDQASSGGIRAPYDASPMSAVSFPRSFTTGEGSFSPWIPSPYSPAPSGADYPDMWWGPSWWAKYLSDFYETSYGSVFIEPDLGEDFFYILLRWTPPLGSWDALKIVRRKYGPPETVDDGIVVLTTTDKTRSEFVETRPQGEYCFYGVFVRNPIGGWEKCGSIDALNCRNHDGFEEHVNAIPRVYTSSGGMLDAVDKAGFLSRFLQAVSFEYDYWKTQADGIYGPLESLPAPLVAMWASQLGMSNLDIATIGDRNLRRWLASASECTQMRGTKDGIEKVATAITGWSVSAVLSPNMLLDPDDSSAEAIHGDAPAPRWKASGGTIRRIPVAGSTTAPSSNIVTNDLHLTPFLRNGVFEVTASGSSTVLDLGSDSPTEFGIPIHENTSYSANACIRSVSGTPGSCSLQFMWYDVRGTTIPGPPQTPTSSTLTSPWAQTSTHSAVSPSGAAYLAPRLTWTSTAGSVMNFDMVQVAPSSASIADKYYEARGIDLLVHPTRINHCTNPTFETGVHSWTTGTQGPDGSGCVGGKISRKALLLTHIDITSGTSYVTPVTSDFGTGTPITVSMHLYPRITGTYSCDETLAIINVSSHNLTVGSQVEVRFSGEGHPASATYQVTSVPGPNSFTVAVSGGSGTGAVEIVPVTNSSPLKSSVPVVLGILPATGTTNLRTVTKALDVEYGRWNRVQVTLDPIPTDCRRIKATVGGADSSVDLKSSDRSLYLDGVLIEQRDSMLSYFDAGLYADAGNGRWEGTAGDSRSFLFPDRLTRQAVLARVMAKEVPEPCFLRVVL